MMAPWWWVGCGRGKCPGYSETSILGDWEELIPGSKIENTEGQQVENGRAWIPSWAYLVWRTGQTSPSSRPLGMGEIMERRHDTHSCRSELLSSWDVMKLPKKSCQKGQRTELQWGVRITTKRDHGTRIWFTKRRVKELGPIPAPSLRQVQWLVTWVVPISSASLPLEHDLVCGLVSPVEYGRGASSRHRPNKAVALWGSLSHHVRNQIILLQNPYREGGDYVRREMPSPLSIPDGTSLLAAPSQVPDMPASHLR